MLHRFVILFFLVIGQYAQSQLKKELDSSKNDSRFVDFRKNNAFLKGDMIYMEVGNMQYKNALVVKALDTFWLYKKNGIVYSRLGIIHKMKLDKKKLSIKEIDSIISKYSLSVKKIIRIK